ncbi:tetratricopeptide repeat protein [Kovacikia minuta CCNUW1]|uniref:tetratricopeptide repeat protein n=1 Tax=Kovacikia minuta TaxID=2931930 RepID=UPI001CCF7BDF|nr:tetratricopeptide repeat protein [Kovacikia minuta]UBF27114.1 tetratricopeptide repeat protein [Kovacikia minuta CCNUW1]
MAKKLGNKDEVRLVKEPVEVLTPLFLQDLIKLAEQHHLLLLFDVYERTSSSNNTRRFLLRGLYYQSIERHEEALQDFTQAIELEPKGAFGITMRGQTYQLLGRYEEALQDYNRAIELNPQNTWAIAQHGETLLLLGLYSEALANFNQVIALNLDNDWYLYDRAISYLALKMLKLTSIGLFNWLNSNMTKSLTIIKTPLILLCII